MLTNRRVRRDPDLNATQDHGREPAAAGGPPRSGIGSRAGARPGLPATPAPSLSAGCARPHTGSAIPARRALAHHRAEQRGSRRAGQSVPIQRARGPPLTGAFPSWPEAGRRRRSPRPPPRPHGGAAAPQRGCPARNSAAKRQDHRQAGRMKQPRDSRPPCAQPATPCRIASCVEAGRAAGWSRDPSSNSARRSTPCARRTARAAARLCGRGPPKPTQPIRPTAGRCASLPGRGERRPAA